MPRRFTDPDGREWTVEASSIMPKMEPGEPVTMMGEVSFRVHFSSDNPPASRWIVVGPDIGRRVEGDLSCQELVKLLEQAANG